MVITYVLILLPTLFLKNQSLFKAFLEYFLNLKYLNILDLTVYIFIYKKIKC